MNRRAMMKPAMMKHSARSRPARKTVAARLLVPLLLALPLALGACQQREQPPLAGTSIGGAFALVDKAGKTVRWADFAGQWRIVYFGYTFCPDACPTDVGIFMKGFNQFAKAHPQEAARVQPIFISVDPERDSPARVGEFSAAFGPRLLGLTGTTAQVDAAAKAFAVYHTKGAVTPGGGYLVDHSRATYLFDPQGKPIALLPTDLGDRDGPAAVAAELAKWVR
ncbi:SCO family protein [Novosphingobium bradum]|uniref:SCO family protein n=1 Tax=Novosphingobium bradum TaxID=1737444 RepID=A0ABV7ISR7_9SPHN